MEEAPSTPLVSWILLSYNQEEHIEDALIGVFSQAYSPLEIVISDDFSSDRTFEIIKSKAAKYRGSHNILVTRNKKNLGIAGNINSALEKCNGDIVVLSAGDDVSLPTRAKTIVDAFETTNACLVHSSAVMVDKNGEEVGKCFPSNSLMQNPSVFFAATSMALYIGATGAFKRELYEKFGKISYQHAYEDLIFGFRAILAGGCHYIPEPLVNYRVGSGVTSRVAYTQDAIEKKNAALKSTLVQIHVLKQRIQDLKKARPGRFLVLFFKMRLRLFAVSLKRCLLIRVPIGLYKFK